jgi:hypothetical protein
MRSLLEWSPHRQEPVAPFKNATSREFRIPPPAGAGGFQFAGIEAPCSKLQGIFDPQGSNNLF